MIADDDVERVRDAADIVQLIGEHVSLRRVGTDWRGPCPFHQGKNRNFSVSPRKRMFYCFVCHEGGDVFSFLQKKIGVDWPTAVRMVAEKMGIEIREVESRREGPDPREPFWELNATAAEYFRRVLWEGEIGRPAREYLAQRRVPRELADRFGVGFAPREPGLMRGHLATLGYDDARQLAGGLLVQREGRDEPVSRFRGRLMFPIYDVAGHPVGFGGRAIGPIEPKYLNSSDSEIFSKGKLLYGLNWAKHAIRRDERVILVEGYFDVIRLAGAGIESVVAPLGTALTSEQATLLTRYTKNVFLLYDSDKAGLKATFRAGDELLGHGTSVRVVTLPEGEDPDTFVDKHGRDALEHHIQSAVDVFDRKIQLLERAGWFVDLHKRRRAIDRLLPTIRVTRDPVTRDMYLARTSEASGVDRTVLQREIESGAARTGPASRSSTVSEHSGPGLPLEQGSNRRVGDRRGGGSRLAAAPGYAAERELVRAVLARPALMSSIASRTDIDAFRDPAYHEIFSALVRLGPEPAIEQLAEMLSAGATEVLERLLAARDAFDDIDRTVDDSILDLQRRVLRERAAAINLGVASTDEEKDDLLREKASLVKQLSALHPKSSADRARSDS